MTNPATPRAKTVGVIADELGVSRERVQYVVRTRSIPSFALAGSAKLYDGAAVTAIRAALDDINAKKPPASDGEARPALSLVTGEGSR